MLKQKYGTIVEYIWLTEKKPVPASFLLYLTNISKCQSDNFN